MKGSPARLPVWLTAVLAVIAVAVAVTAIAAGVIESGKPGVKAEGSTTPRWSVTYEPPAPGPEPTWEETLEPETLAEVPPPPPAVEPVQEPPAAAPQVIGPVQVPQVQPPPVPQLPQAPAVRPVACPTGAVISGLTGMEITNERPTAYADIFTVADVAGHGAIRNGTNVAVNISTYGPSVVGLDEEGLIVEYLRAELAWKPPQGAPRPIQIVLEPGQSVTYAIAKPEVRTSVLREITAWYSDPADPIYEYTDIRLVSDCGDVPVVAHAAGPGILNTYIPWGQ